MRAEGYEITAQARQSPALVACTRYGFFAPYHEKTQAGLQLLDLRGVPLVEQRYPQRVYGRVRCHPPLVVDTLVFIENRELLPARGPKRNPAIELPRLIRAVLERAIVAVDPDYPGAGGSTLATQLEKFRHSPEGRTASVVDKLRQMISASVRVYLDGADTTLARQRIVVDYLDSVPLGATPGHGEVHGIGDGPWAWYGADFEAANRALRAPLADGTRLQEQALAYRQVLSLIIAQRRPSFYFGSGHDRLARLGDARAPNPFSARKAETLLRVQLAALLDVPRLYDLDRLDLATQSSIDAVLQSAVSAQLRALRERDRAKAAGLVGPRLLERGDPAGLVYSFMLYERTADANRLRVQADSLDQPFDLNAGAKLELGSTAKRRTLITCLEIVAALHQQYAGMAADELHRVPVAQRDRLTRWALDHLARARDRSLPAMLDAAMRRRYSASPNEVFFTGGGAHVFENFRREDNQRSPTVDEALQDSINLAFVRLMRDIVHHFIYRDPAGAARVLDEPDNAQRSALLARFADREVEFSHDEIADAWASTDFEPFLAPRVDLRTRALVAAQASMFWRHPTRGVLAPDVFMPALRAQGLNDDVVWQLLRKSSAQCSALHQHGLRLQVAVDLSSPRWPTSTSPRACCKPPSGKTLHRNRWCWATELSAETELGETLESLVRLRLAGFGLAISDFGTGKMSMDQLERIAFTELVVHPTVVTDAWRDGTTRAGLATGLEMARDMALPAVADGVQTREDWEFVRQWRCDAAQGGYIAPPMPLPAFIEWAAAWELRRPRELAQGDG